MARDWVSIERDSTFRIPHSSFGIRHAALAARQPISALGTEDRGLSIHLSASRTLADRAAVEQAADQEDDEHRPKDKEPVHVEPHGPGISLHRGNPAKRESVNARAHAQAEKNSALLRSAPTCDTLVWVAPSGTSSGRSTRDAPASRRLQPG